MNIDIEDFRDKGYCHIPKMFSWRADGLLDSAAEVFRNGINRVGGCGYSLLDIEHGMRKLFNEDFETFVHCGKTCQNIWEMYETASDRQVLNLLHGIGLAVPTISTRPVMFFNHPDLAKKEVYYKTPPHQDWRSIQGSLNSVVLWIPLADVPMDL